MSGRPAATGLGQWWHSGSSPWRETACTTARGCASVIATATSSMVSPVPATTTGLPSMAGSSAPGSHGSAM